MRIVRLNLEHVSALAGVLAKRMVTEYETPPDDYRIFGVPRGGVPVAFAVASALHSVGYAARVVDNAADARFLVDDIVDSGSTRDAFQAQYPDKPFLALVEKASKEEWVAFPWEDAQLAGADDIPTRLLQYIGEDANRGGLIETPRRFLKAWDHWTKGYNETPEDILKVFEDGGETYDQMVLVRDIPVYSKCEHHLADIFGVAHVAYIPNGKICGLSKLSRLVDCFARRLQVQERLTDQIANSLYEHLDAKGVAVMLRCRHMCMESRGICQQGHTTVTTAIRGVFATDPSAKAEFLQQVNA